jgi:hypothetical protein
MPASGEPIITLIADTPQTLPQHKCIKLRQAPLAYVLLVIVLIMLPVDELFTGNIKDFATT